MSYHIEKESSLQRCKTGMIKPRALMVASVASMHDLFNMDNIYILLELGYDVDVAANFESGSTTSQERVEEYRQELVNRGIGVYHIPIPRKLDKIEKICTSYHMIRELTEKNRYRIIHCHSPIGGVICRLACRKSRNEFGTKIIYTAHGFHFFKGADWKAWLFFYPAEKICAKFTDVIITINQEDYKIAQKFNAKKIEHVPGVGVRTEQLRNMLIDPASKRHELGLTSDNFVFMSAGELSVRKNHEVAIRAFAEIEEPGARYLIVGLGELEAKLKKLVLKLGLQNRIFFLGYRADVKEILQVADAFVFPSLQEGLPVALMEAMTVGLPVVCSRIRGNTDLIEDGRGGYLYDCHDVSGFANGMRRIMNASDTGMGETNIETMKQFDIGIVHEYMKRIYGEVV